MQNRETKGFFFNKVLKRPVILRTLLRGLSHHREEKGEGDEERADLPSPPGSPFQQLKGDPARGDQTLKKICGL